MMKLTTMLQQCSTRVCNFDKKYSKRFVGTDIMHFTNNPLFSFFSEAVENAKENISEEDPKSTNQSVDINTKTETQPGTKSNDCAKSPQGSETCVLHLNTLETRF